MKEKGSGMKKLISILDRKINTNFLLSAILIANCFYYVGAYKFNEYSKEYIRKYDRVELDFTNERIGEEVKSTENISGRELWGRWIDGEDAKIRFEGVFDGKYILNIQYQCVKDKNKQGFYLKMGEVIAHVDANNCASDVFEMEINIKYVDAIEIKPNYWIFVGQDTRKLSIGLKKIRIQRVNNAV